jgi:hypothetical protein
MFHDSSHSDVPTRKTLKYLSPFYIQKPLDQIAGPVRNTSRLRDGSLVEARTDAQSKKLLKPKLLGPHPVLVEKQNPQLNQGCPSR